MKIALAQISCELNNVAANLAKISSFTKNAAGQGADIVIFPELADTGYQPCTVASAATNWPGDVCSQLTDIAASNKINVLCGIAEKTTGGIYNSLAYIQSNGEIGAIYRKTHLFSPPPVSEDKYFVAGDKAEIVNISGTNIGLSICYDLRFPELYRKLMLGGATVLVNSSAWPRKRAEHWDCLTKARAIENQAFFLAVGRVGDDSGLIMNGCSRVISPYGEIIAEASESQETLLLAEINLQAVTDFRTAIPAVTSRRTDMY